MLTKGIVILISYTLFLVVVPFSHPNNYIFLPCLIGSIVSLVSLYLMYTFLGSAPDAQQTITNSLHMHFSIILALSVIRETILVFLFNLLDEPAKDLFEANPNLMCSLSSDRLISMPAGVVYFMIAMSKLYLINYPLDFQGLDHKLLARLAIALTICLPALDSVIRLLTHGTLCNAVFLENVLIDLYGLNISTSTGKYFELPWELFLLVSGYIYNL